MWFAYKVVEFGNLNVRRSYYMTIGYEWIFNDEFFLMGVKIINSQSKQLQGALLQNLEDMKLSN